VCYTASRLPKHCECVSSVECYMRFNLVYWLVWLIVYNSFNFSAIWETRHLYIHMLFAVASCVSPFSLKLLHFISGALRCKRSKLRLCMNLEVHIHAMLMSCRQSVQHVKRKADNVELAAYHWIVGTMCDICVYKTVTDWLCVTPLKHCQNTSSVLQRTSVLW